MCLFLASRAEPLLLLLRLLHESCNFQKQNNFQIITNSEKKAHTHINTLKKLIINSTPRRDRERESEKLERDRSVIYAHGFLK